MSYSLAIVLPRSRTRNLRWRDRITRREGFFHRLIQQPVLMLGRRFVRTRRDRNFGRPVSVLLPAADRPLFIGPADRFCHVSVSCPRRGRFYAARGSAMLSR